MLLEHDDTVRQIFALQELRLNIHQIFKRDLSKVSQVTKNYSALASLYGYHMQSYSSQAASEEKTSWHSRMEAPKTKVDKSDRNSVTNSLLDYQEMTTCLQTNTSNFYFFAYQTLTKVYKSMA